MLNFIKKDMRIFLRDYKELALLILMPFILISILGLALGNFLNSEQPSLNVKFALVIEDDAEQGKELFFQEWEMGENLTVEDYEEIFDGVQLIQPIEIVRGLFDSEEFAAFGTYSVMDAAEAAKALENDEIAAIITIPDQFTYHLLNKMILNIGEGSEIQLEGSADHAFSTGILQDILGQFARTLNFQIAINQFIFTSETDEFVQDDTTGSAAETIAVSGGVEDVSQLESFSSIQYYTFGMVVMFVLFVAGMVSGKAYHERRQFTFDRMIIAGSHPMKFLGGKTISAFVMTLLQLIVLFSLSTLIFQTFAGKSLSIWIGIVLVSLALACCVGGLAALLTAINFRTKSDNSTEIFSGMIVTLISLLGGSFFPTWQISDWVATLGQWTPNGGALHAFLQVTQGAEMDRYLPAILRLIMTAGFFFALSVWIFPRRKVD